MAEGRRFVRHKLDPCCWVDRVEGFLDGADSLFDEVEQSFHWEQGRRLMYGTWHDEPRLTARLEFGDREVPPVVDAAVEVLEGHYRRSFTGLFCNYYRGGGDGVAWHGDRIGRQVVDPLVAIISLGGPRWFAMRDTSGSSPTRRWQLCSGDLLVMGGATQHHWEHSVPKSVTGPPRISLTTRAGWPDEATVPGPAGGRAPVGAGPAAGVGPPGGGGDDS